MRHETTQEPVLVDINGIADLLAISTRTARRVVREPGFPQAVRIRGCVRWRRCDVVDHVEKLVGHLVCGGLVAPRLGPARLPCSSVA